MLSNLRRNEKAFMVNVINLKSPVCSMMGKPLRMQKMFELCIKINEF